MESNIPSPPGRTSRRSIETSPSFAEESGGRIQSENRIDRINEHYQPTRTFQPDQPYTGGRNVFRRRTEYSSPEITNVSPDGAFYRSPYERQDESHHGHSTSRSSSSENRLEGSFPHSSYAISAPSPERAHKSYHQPFPPIQRHQSYGHHGYGYFPGHSSSFESHGLGPPPVGSNRYHFAPPYPGGYGYYPWAHPPPVEYIASVNPCDVLSGRGGATNSHPGNRAFRSLVKEHQDEYLKAKKRDKPAVASQIVDKIREQGGRFLRRAGTSPQRQTLWIEIGDDRAREKTCQALREGAPEIRRKRKKSAGDVEDTKESDVALTSSSSVEGTISGTTEDANRGRSSTFMRQSTMEKEAPSANQQIRTDEHTVIRPSMLLVRRQEPVSISVDELNDHDRNLYLQDFLPPRPTIRRGTTEPRFLIAQHEQYSSSTQDNEADPWPVVSV